MCVQGHTALHKAAVRGRLQAMEILFTAGADCTIQDAAVLAILTWI